ncbi:MAG: GFA family protein [Gammaproteobacteria bacterium]
MSEKTADSGGAADSKNAAVCGGCVCGAVRYQFTGKMMWPGICHCAICRKMGGAAGGAWFGVLRDCCEISGKTAIYEYTADSGNRVSRAVCEKCRAPVYNQNSMMSDVIVFAAGSLDKPELFAPRMRIYTAGAPAWCAPDDGLPRFPGMPSSEKSAHDAEFHAAAPKTAPEKGE